MKTISPLTLSALLALALAGSAGAITLSPSPSDGFNTRMPRISSGPQHATGQILVKLKPGASLDQFLKETGLQVLSTIPQLGVEVLSVPDGAESETAKQLAGRADVAYAETDGIAHAKSTPNDTYFESDQWYLPQIGATAAWDVATGTTAPIIAVLDTGANLQHPDLKTKLLTGYNAINTSATANDDDGHGSHISGLAAAAVNNSAGIAGVSWTAKILPVKVLNASGDGSDSQISRGITWAADNGAKVFNMSLGGEAYNSTLAAAVLYAQNKGGLVIVAAGNEYESGNPVEYPAALPNVMAVGASNDTDTRASYSNAETYVSVLAPGGDPDSNNDNDVRHWILSDSISRYSSYEYMAGTSQATALVSGLAALLWAIRPDDTAAQIRSVIEQTAVDVGTPGVDNDSGHGRVDALAAVKAITQTDVPGDINGDGTVDVTDAILLLRVVTGQAQMSDISIGDVAPYPGTGGRAYGDGQITVADVARILRRSVGLEPNPWPGTIT